MWGLSNKMLCTFLAQKGAVKVLKSKVGGLKIWYFELTLTFHCACKSGRTRFSPFFFRTPKFDLWLHFCSPLRHSNAQYFIWKSLQFFNGMVSSQEHSSSFKLWFLHSKCPHLCNVYLVGMCKWMSMTVSFLPIVVCSLLCEQRIFHSYKQ